MFSLILSGAGTLLFIYVAWRLVALPWVGNALRQRLLLGTALLWLIYVTGVALNYQSSGFAWLLAQCALHLLAALFLLSTDLLTVDLVTGFGRWFPHSAARWRAGALAIGALLISIALIQGFRAPVVTEYEVRVSALPSTLDGTVIVALSDLHLGAPLGSAWLAKRTQQVRALAPDLIVLLGDNVEKGPDTTPRSSNTWSGLAFRAA